MVRYFRSDKLSKRAAAYHPGAGVYRSSYKNAMRLTRTETNMAYRTADHLRWQQMNFVIGIEIRTSNHHPAPDICDDLKGRYPKDFKFVGWHPQCRCHAVPILSDLDEMIEWGKQVVAGEADIDSYQPEQISELPTCFRNWVATNEERVRNASSMPYFLKDNQKYLSANNNPNNIYTNTYIAAMKNAGIVFDESTFKNAIKNNPFNNLNIIELNNEINSILTMHNISTTACRIRAEENQLYVSWHGIDFALERKFFINNQGEKCVDHAYFKLPRLLQGQGISKLLTRTMYRQYKQIGVKRIEIYANVDVGGYCWARYGFCAKSRADVVGALNYSSLTTEQEEIVIAIIDKHFEQTNAPFPMNKIAELSFGKSALLGGAWEGVLDLKDIRQAGNFERYLFS